MEQGDRVGLLATPALLGSLELTPPMLGSLKLTLPMLGCLELTPPMLGSLTLPRCRALVRLALLYILQVLNFNPMKTGKTKPFTQVNYFETPAMLSPY